MGTFDIERQNARHKYRKHSKKKNRNIHHDNDIKEYECNYDTIDDIDPNINNIRYGSYNTIHKKKKKEKKKQKMHKDSTTNSSFDYSKSSKTIATNKKLIDSTINSNDSQKLYKLIDMLCNIIATRDRNDAYHRNLKAQYKEDDQSYRNLRQIVISIMISCMIMILSLFYFIYKYNVEELRSVREQNSEIINTVRYESDLLNNKNEQLRQILASINENKKGE